VSLLDELAGDSLRDDPKPKRRRVVDLLDPAAQRVTERRGRRYLDLLAPPDPEAMAAAERGDVFTGEGGRAARLAPVRIDAPAPTGIEAGIARAREGPEIDRALEGLQAVRRSRTLPQPQVDESNPVVGLGRELALGALSGPANMVTTYGEGLARTLGLKGAADAIDKYRTEEMEPAFETGTGLGAGASIASNLASQALPYMALGGAVAGAVPGGALLKGLAAAGATLPLTGVQSMAGPEGSTVGMLADMTKNETLGRIAKSTPARVAADVGLDAALGAATEILPPVAGALRRGERPFDLVGEAVNEAADAAGHAAGRATGAAAAGARRVGDYASDLWRRINLIGAEPVEYLPNVRELPQGRGPLALPPGRAAQAALDGATFGAPQGPAIPVPPTPGQQLEQRAARVLDQARASRETEAALPNEPIKIGEATDTAPAPQPAAAARQDIVTPAGRRAVDLFGGRGARDRARAGRDVRRA
jgi:hypothetical protein